MDKYRALREAVERVQKKAAAKQPDPAMAEASLLRYHRREEDLRQLLRQYGAELISAMNDEIEKVWKERKPVMKKGPNAGKPRPVPCFAPHFDQLIVFENDKRRNFPIVCRIVEGVFSRSHPEVPPQPYFANEAWANAIPRVNEVIKAFSARSAAEERQDSGALVKASQRSTPQQTTPQQTVEEESNDMPTFGM